MSATPDDDDRAADVGDGYPIEWEGDLYQPVPEWWIAHQDATTGEEKFGPRLYATSYAILPERTMTIRYIHPTIPRCIVVEVPYCETELGMHPLDLTTATRWSHSIYPGRRPVDDVARPAEWRHLREIWADRVDEVPADREEIGSRYGGLQHE
jgi:hypothetical protein